MPTYLFNHIVIRVTDDEWFSLADIGKAIGYPCPKVWTRLIEPTEWKIIECSAGKLLFASRKAIEFLCEKHKKVRKSKLKEWLAWLDYHRDPRVAL